LSALRVLFAGTPDVALPALDLLLEDDRLDVVAVLTNPDRPRGRSGRAQPSPVAQRAMEAGLEVLRPQRPVDDVDRIRETGAQVGAVVAYGKLLPTPVLNALALGFVNLHFSLLPRWRGAAPVQRALRAGDTTTGLTVFRLDEGMDTGPVLRSKRRQIPPHVDAGELLAQLAVEGAPLLVEGLLALAAGEQPQAQPTDGATLAPRIGPEDAVVDWTLDAEAVGRLVRSVTPKPGATTTLGDERIRIAGVRAVEVAHDTPPGTLQADGGDVIVSCGRGGLLIERVQFPGRAWTSAADQVRGRRLATGMVLGKAAGAI